MAELKTQPHDGDVNEFLNKVEPLSKRDDSYKVKEIMEEITGAKAVMWGPSIIGFGDYHYKYASGREADWFYTGFSPRKQALTLYIMSGFSRYESLMEKLGKFKTGKGCLYIKKIDDIDITVLKELITESVNYLRSKN
ncbi:DUF1801 domain-containing protein [Marinoscillum pacificum]|uniref:DUF1801 domain-containing protein n=1 Tax=Marinoscillum pacificum TaxID=392723 RepID=UPI002157FDED|nr:DUF1801 domain-containing protein [Marinoscillum pacificum]